MVSYDSVGPLAKEEHLAALDSSPGLHALIAAALTGRPLTTAVIDGSSLGLADDRVPGRRGPADAGAAGTGLSPAPRSGWRLSTRCSAGSPATARISGRQAVRVYDPDRLRTVTLYGLIPTSRKELTVLIDPVIHRSQLVLGDRIWVAQFQGEALNLPPLLAFAPAGTLFGSLIMTAVLAAYLNATQRRSRRYPGDGGQFGADQPRTSAPHRRALPHRDSARRE